MELLAKLADVLALASVGPIPVTINLERPLRPPPAIIEVEPGELAFERAFTRRLGGTGRPTLSAQSLD